MKTACLCAILFGLSLVSATAHAAPLLVDPPEETAASPDYNIFADPSAPNVTQKAGGTVPVVVGVRVLPINGFRKNIGLSAADLPPGVSAVFRPAVVATASGDVRSHLTLSVAGTVRPGVYLVDVQSKVAGSHLTRHTPLSLLISPPVRAAGFTLIVSPDGLDIEPGDAPQSVTFILKPNARFRGPVTLRLQDDPAAVLGTPKLSTRTLTARRRVSTLTFRLRPTAAEGFHNLLITATAPSGTQTVAVPIQVLPDTRHAMSERMPTITERPGQPEPPLAAGPEDMLKFHLDETDDSKSPRKAAPRPQAVPHIPSPAGLITLYATIKDSAGRPITGAVLIVTDGDLKELKKSDSVVRFSDAKGQTYIQLPSTPDPCYVTVNAQGYLPPITEEISGADDTDLTFVLKRKPKASHPKQHTRTSPQPSP